MRNNQKVLKFIPHYCFGIHKFDFLVEILYNINISINEEVTKNIYGKVLLFRTWFT